MNGTTQPPDATPTTLLAETFEAITETVKEAQATETALQAKIAAHEATIAELQRKLAEAKTPGDVILQKVAYSRNDVNGVLDKMITQGFLHPDHREKTAQALMDDRGGYFAVNLLDRVVSVHDEPMPQPGTATISSSTKNANDTKPKDPTKLPRRGFGVIKDDEDWGGWFSRVNGGRPHGV